MIHCRVREFLHRRISLPHQLGNHPDSVIDVLFAGGTISVTAREVLNKITQAYPHLQLRETVLSLAECHFSSEKDFLNDPEPRSPVTP